MVLSQPMKKTTCDRVWKQLWTSNMIVAHGNHVSYAHFLSVVELSVVEPNFCVCFVAAALDAAACSGPAQTTPPDEAQMLF